MTAEVASVVRRDRHQFGVSLHRKILSGGLEAEPLFLTAVKSVVNRELISLARRLGNDDRHMECRNRRRFFGRKLESHRGGQHRIHRITFGVGGTILKVREMSIDA